MGDCFSLESFKLYTENLSEIKMQLSIRMNFVAIIDADKNKLNKMKQKEAKPSHTKHIFERSTRI